MAIQTALKRIDREIGVKRCIILDGNVQDLYIDGKKKLVCLTDYLTNKLEESQYSIIKWDVATGLKGDTDILAVTDIDESQSDTGTSPYIIDDEEDLDSGQNQAGGVDPSHVRTIKDICNLIRVNMTRASDRKLAFIIEWGEYAFGDNARSDEMERQCLAMLGKAIKDRPITPSLRAEENLIIIITGNLSMIPVSFYQKNADVSCITISKPDREEREMLFESRKDRYNILQEKDVIKRKSHIDMMEGLTNREILQMGMMSQKGPKMTFEKLFFLFKYGESDNPWEKLDYEAVMNFKNTIGCRVIGQDEAIRKVEQTVVKAYMGLSGIHKSSSRNAPKGVLFFVGPTGVGKTELSKSLAKFLFGDENACIRFDMSEYANETSDQKLIGAPPGYVGFEEGGQLTNAVKEKPFSIILFDEIEKAAKANPRILDIFLQILEDGRLTDNKGETVYFSESVIIFTSNLGSSEIEPVGTDSEIAEKFLEKVKHYFNKELGRPELLGRIGYGNIVPFNFIKDPLLSKRIASSKLLPIKTNILEKFGLKLIFENEASFVETIVKNTDTSKGGRDILNTISELLLNELAMFLFINKSDLEDLRGEEIEAFLEDGTVRFRFK